MTKRPPLDIDALAFAGGHPANPVETIEKKRAGRARQPRRTGRVPVQAWVAEETRKRFCVAALRMDKTSDELLQEMIAEFLRTGRH